MAKQSIFNNPYKTIESWSAQGAVVNWGTTNGASKPLPLIMNSLQLSYTQNISPQFPINIGADGTKKRINIKGAPSGSLTVGSIYSPTHEGLEEFIKAVSKDCKTDNDQVMLTIRPFGTLECDQSVNTVLYLSGLELTTISVVIQGGDIALVSMPTQYIFTGLDWEF